MADNNEPVLSQEQQVDNSKAELDRMMQLSLTGKFPEEQQQGNGSSGGTQQSPTNQSAADTNNAPENLNSIADLFAPIKDKFGYNSPEDVIREVEELRAFKANPVKEEIKFENETSEKLFKALKQGKESEIYEYLEKKSKLDRYTSAEIDERTAEDVIKLGMKIKYNDLSDTEIDYRFKKQFPSPKEPVQGIDEDVEDFDKRKQEWLSTIDDIKMNKIIEAKLMRPELENAKTKLVLPDIESSDQDYLNYKKMVEQSKKEEQEIQKAYNSFTPEQFETKVNFTDDANKISFDFEFKPDSESFKKSVEFASDINKFFEQFTNQDGTPDRKKFLDAIYFAMNKEKILMEAMKQTKNATIKANLPDNSGGGLNRHNPSFQEPSELAKQMEVALRV